MAEQDYEPSTRCLATSAGHRLAPGSEECGACFRRVRPVSSPETSFGNYLWSPYDHPGLVLRPATKIRDHAPWVCWAQGHSWLRCTWKSLWGKR